MPTGGAVALWVDVRHYGEALGGLRPLLPQEEECGSKPVAPRLLLTPPLSPQGL